MKVINSKHINPFGGINFVFESFNKLGIDKILQERLPVLAKQSRYSWKDILYSFWSVFFCGGDCIEDIGLNLKHHLSENNFIKPPSPDRIIERFKSLSKPIVDFNIDNRYAVHSFALNDLLNSLLINISKQTGLLNGKDLVLDYDNTIIYTNKLDSKKTYKKVYGYQPGVAFINNQVVYIENRNGNSQAGTKQDETLKRMFTSLKSQNISVNIFRADGASFQLKILKLLEQEVNYFYIRTPKAITISRLIQQIEVWDEVKFADGTIAYRTEIAYTPFKGKTARINNVKESELSTYRLIITKIKRKDKQVDMFTNEPYIYRCIITNDWSISKDEVVMFYNQRGAVEKQFDILKHDFSWQKLAFSKLEHNTVFLVFSAICKNLYDYIITAYSKKCKFLNPKFRIKKFIFRFICIPAKWILHSRQNTLKVFGPINFKT